MLLQAYRSRDVSSHSSTFTSSLSPTSPVSMRGGERPEQQQSLREHSSDRPRPQSLSLREYSSERPRPLSLRECSSERPLHTSEGRDRRLSLHEHSAGRGGELEERGFASGEACPQQQQQQSLAGWCLNRRSSAQAPSRLHVSSGDTLKPAMQVRSGGPPDSLPLASWARLMALFVIYDSHLPTNDSPVLSCQHGCMGMLWNLGSSQLPVIGGDADGSRWRPLRG